MSKVVLCTTFAAGPKFMAEAITSPNFAVLPSPHGAANVVTVSSTVAASRNEATCAVEGLGAAVKHCALRMLFTWQQRRGQSGVHWCTYGAASDGFFLWLVKLSVVERADRGPLLVVEVSTRLPLWPAAICTASTESPVMEAETGGIDTAAAAEAVAAAAAAGDQLPAGLRVLIALMTADREALGSVPVLPPADSTV